ncbi:hypothetical protein [Paludibaculum fermentans]|uniref:PEP-CTERM protein-sorting domain-containing protein n=1 Tax=Paludibaculum fermentans TaxID=1473598 RepID=A0A7S7NSV8_PALFE|nr:hypothetical protein [Paludibaculum fermentans]QOY89113.1 hypothetical protein IRI77_03900 [Paludibaculum fermentans]
MKRILWGIAAAWLSLPAGATTLTGVNLYGTDATGAAHLDPAYWSTSGGGDGAFVWDGSNWSNQVRTPDLNYVLTPGFYGLDAYGEGHPDLAFVAVNLYFNGNTAGAPHISMLTVPNTGIYDVNPAATNLNLPGSGNKPSGQLWFDDGVNRVDVIGVWWFNTGVADVVGPDEVGQLVGSAHTLDSFAHILLQVSPSQVSQTPEPASACLTISGLAGLLLAARWTRKQ